MSMHFFHRFFLKWPFSHTFNLPFSTSLNPLELLVNSKAPFDPPPPPIITLPYTTLRVVSQDGRWLIRVSWASFLIRPAAVNNNIHREQPRNQEPKTIQSASANTSNPSFLWSFSPWFRFRFQFQLPPPPKTDRELKPTRNYINHIAKDILN